MENKATILSPRSAALAGHGARRHLKDATSHSNPLPSGLIAPTSVPRRRPISDSHPEIALLHSLQDPSLTFPSENGDDTSLSDITMDSHSSEFTDDSRATPPGNSLTPRSMAFQPTPRLDRSAPPAPRTARGPSLPTPPRAPTTPWPSPARHNDTPTHSWTSPPPRDAHPTSAPHPRPSRATTTPLPGVTVEEEHRILRTLPPQARSMLDRHARDLETALAEITLDSLATLTRSAAQFRSDQPNTTPPRQVHFDVQPPSDAPSPRTRPRHASPPPPAPAPEPTSPGLMDTTIPILTAIHHPVTEGWAELGPAEHAILDKAANQLRTYNVLLDSTKTSPLFLQSVFCARPPAPPSDEIRDRFTHAIRHPAHFLTTVRQPFTPLMLSGMATLLAVCGVPDSEHLQRILHTHSKDHLGQDRPMLEPIDTGPLTTADDITLRTTITLAHALLNQHISSTWTAPRLPTPPTLDAPALPATPVNATSLHTDIDWSLLDSPEAQFRTAQEHRAYLAARAADMLTPPTEDEQFLFAVSERCTTLSPELRPEQFPRHLWPLVADNQKPGLIERWRKFSKFRMAGILTGVFKQIRVYDGTPERARQKDCIRAQILANIDRYYHPEEDDPPTIPGVAMEINLSNPACTPVHVPIRRLQPLERASLKARCIRMKRQGKLQDSRSAWNSPVHMVPYRDRIAAFLEKYGEHTTTALAARENEDEVIALFRMTGDFRLLNLLSDLERYPLPRIMELIDSCVERSNRYSAGDIADAFFCVELLQRCRHLTAFGTPDAHLEYCVMPQGVKSAANVWARTIANIFSDLLYVYKILVYQDDVVNSAKQFLEHFDTQQAIYDRLGLNRLIYKPTKSTANFPDQRLLGHVMSEHGRAVDPNLVATIRGLGPPRTLTEVMSLLGLAKVAVDYVPELSAILTPLHELNKKTINVRHAWRPDYHGVALDRLKTALTSTPVLQIPNLYKPFRVHVDACKTGRGIGAVLLQQHFERPEEWHPVAYWSRALQAPERKFSATELEATAMHDAILHWRPYLYCTGQTFDVYVDHYALVYLVTKMGGHAHSHQRLTRLCLDLQPYSFNVIHRKGKHHIDADAISRLLMQDEVAFVNTDLTLRDDHGPLSDSERANISDFYRNDSSLATLVTTTIDSCRAERADAQRAAAALHMEAIFANIVTTARPPTAAPPPDGHACPHCTATVCRSAIISAHVSLRPASMPIDHRASTARGLHKRELERRLTNSDLRLHATENYEHLTTYLRELADRTICTHTSPHHAHTCDPLRIREVRSHALRLMIQHRTDAIAKHGWNLPATLQVLTTAQHAAITEELQRRDGIAHCPAPVTINSQQLAPPPSDQSAPTPEPAHNTRRAREAREAEAQLNQELLAGDLAHYHYLHGLVYIDPASGGAFEIIDTIIRRRRKKNGGPVVHTIAWPINHHNRQPAVTRAQQQDATFWQKLPLRTARERVEDYIQAANPAPDTPYPTSPAEWLTQQLLDPEMQQAVESLTGEECIRLHRTGRHDEHHFDFLHRERAQDGTLGPLLRTFSKHGTAKFGHLEHTTFQRIDQIVVPAQMRPAVMRQMHEAMGHPGAERMHTTTRTKYWWPTLIADCKQHSANCHFCAQRKANNRVPKVPIQEYPVPPVPFHTVAIDLTGPFPASTINGKTYTYIMVYKCALTKWVELIPVANKGARTVAPILADLFMRHGPPEVLVSDRGGEFHNALLGQLTQILETRHIRITPVNPRSNGLAENHMRTLKDALYAHVNKKQSNWADFLGVVAHVYNTTVNHATGYTPYYLNHGRQCRTPDLPLSPTVTHASDVDSYITGLRTSLELAWDSISGKNWSDKTDRYNRRPSKPLRFHPYQMDQLVFIKRIPRRFYRDSEDEKKYNQSSKLQARYAGPYRITKCISDVLYEAMIQGQTRRIHAINMKPAYTRLTVAGEYDDEADSDADTDPEPDEDFNPSDSDSDAEIPATQPGPRLPLDEDPQASDNDDDEVDRLFPLHTTPSNHQLSESEDETESDTVAATPAAGAPQELAPAPEPAADPQPPAVAHQEPAADPPPPAAAHQETAADPQTPTDAHQEPTADPPPPAAAHRETAADPQPPAADHQEPAADPQTPAAADPQTPAAAHPEPTAGDHEPAAAPTELTTEDETESAADTPMTSAAPPAPADDPPALVNEPQGTAVAATAPAPTPAPASPPPTAPPCPRDTVAEPAEIPPMIAWRSGHQWESGPRPDEPLQTLTQPPPRRPRTATLPRPLSQPTIDITAPRLSRSAARAAQPTPRSQREIKTPARYAT